MPSNQQVIKGIKWDDLDQGTKKALASGKVRREFLTRNSSCPCGSMKRYKRCCGKETL